MKKVARAYKFGDNISTDLIISGRYKFAIRDMKELAKHVMEDADRTPPLDPSFKGIRRVYPCGLKELGGSIPVESRFYQRIKNRPSFIVAGWNFGMGSSREQAPRAIKEAKIKAVIAKNFARIFYRNAFNIGLRLVECNTDLISHGDTLELDIDKGYLKNRTKNIEISIKPLHPIMKSLLKSGGVVKYFSKHKGLDFGL